MNPELLNVHTYRGVCPHIQGGLVVGIQSPIRSLGGSRWETKNSVSHVDDDVYYYIGERLKLEREAGNMGI